MSPRLAVALLLLLLTNACTTGRVVRFDTGQGALLEYRPPPSSRALAVDEEDFAKALARMVLEVPLAIRSADASGLVRVSHSRSDGDTRWQRLMSQGFSGLCKAGQRRSGCLSLLDDVMGLGEWDKLGIALGLSLDPMTESISRAVEKTLAPQLFYAVISTSLVTWAVLAANPEPVFTKSAALIAAVLLIYLGVDTFLEVVEASRELKRATDQATAPSELAAAGQRFAHRVGPEVARVIVLAVTMVVGQGMTGGAAWLASRVSMLPRFSEAAAVGASQVGIRLENVAHVSAVAIVGGTIVISLPATVMAMVGHGTGAGSAATGATSRQWGSFSGLKSALGPAGKGKQWHHIVEQTPGNVGRFGPRAIHNTENVIPLEEALHTRLSGFYSSIQQEITGSRSLTVRRWLSTQSYEAQREFGLRAIEKVQQGIWGAWK